LQIIANDSEQLLLSGNCSMMANTTCRLAVCWSF